MKLDEVSVGDGATLVLECRDVLPGGVGRGDEVWLRNEGAHVVLHSRGGSVDVIGRSSADRSLLRQLTDGGSASVCWVRTLRNPTEGDKPPSIFLNVITFPPGQTTDDVLVLELGDLNLADIQRHTGLRDADTADLLGWLRADLLLDAHPAESSPDPPADDDAPPRSRVLVSGGANTGVGTAFTIHGRSVVADISQGEGGTWTLSRLAKSRSTRQTVFLLSMPVQVVDKTTAATIREEHKNELLGHLDLEGTQAFLKLWDEYQRLEREAVAREAARVGHARYTSVRPGPRGGWQFELRPEDERFPGLVEVGSFLQATEELPNLRQADRLPAGSTFIGAVTGLRANPPRIDVAEASVDPPPAGYLNMSLASDMRRLKRRDNARETLSRSSGPMPQLGFLVEGLPVATRQVRPVKPLSSVVRAHLGGSPTTRQVDALDVALNTPDVALIQGPPGTGKSSVIAAITARLAQIEDEPAFFSRSTLLSSFQHDAVEAVVSKAQILGLPGLKIGRRFGAGDGERLPAFASWKGSVIASIRANHVGGEGIRSMKEARLLRQRAILPMSSGERGELLRAASSLTAEHLAQELVKEAVALEAATASEDEPQWHRHLRRWLSELADTSLDVEQRLAAAMGASGLLQDNAGDAGESLRLLSEWSARDDPAAELFDRSVEHCRAALDIGRDEAIRESGWCPPTVEQLGLLDRVLAELEENLASSVEAIDRLALEFADRLENDPKGGEDVAKQYSAVLAATCQQAASGAMADMKDGTTIFESVLIDEAARANPLDLLIPMAMGRRRVILVGDHRQLPQMLEPDVEEEIRRSIGDEHAERLKQSLFERMFQYLKELERETGIRRVVTLDTQFRMHPRLGEFVSETFYAEEGGLWSHESTADLVHDLAPHLGRVARWIDVPLSQGSEGREGTGWARPAEAEIVAELVNELVAGRADFSVGVITFYAEQRKLICKALHDRGLMYWSDEGSWISQRPAIDGAVPAELRVGSVDAFQGTEFDVVVLSIVRSNNRTCETADQQRKKWGFLTLPNRLCVATSRQRRLLLVVGDAEMAGGPAVDWAPELAALRRFCVEEEARADD